MNRLEDFQITFKPITTESEDAKLSFNSEDDYDTGWSSDQQSLADQLWIQTVYGTVAVIGIIGNIFVMFTVARVPSLQTKTNAFIVSLAVCDFITSVFLIPLHLGFTFSIPPGVAGTIMCSLFLSQWPLWTSFTASVLSLACVTLERYFSICKPLHYNAIFTQRKVTLLVVAVWIAAIFTNSYMLYVTKFNGVGCTLDWYTVEFQIFVGLGNFAVIYLIPLITMAVCYVAMMKNLSNSASRLNLSSGRETEASLELLRARKKLIKLLATVVITFALCWAPDQFLFLAYNLGAPVDFNSWYYNSGVLIAFCNSAMNPLIYGFKSKSYRKALQIALCGRKFRNDVNDASNNTVATLNC